MEVLKDNQGLSHLRRVLTQPLPNLDLDEAREALGELLALNPGVKTIDVGIDRREGSERLVVCVEPWEWHGRSSAQPSPLVGFPEGIEVDQLRMAQLPRGADGRLDASRIEQGLLITDRRLRQLTEHVEETLGGNGEGSVLVTHQRAPDAELLLPEPKRRDDSLGESDSEGGAAIVDGGRRRRRDDLPATLPELLLAGRVDSPGYVFAFLEGGTIMEVSVERFVNDALATTAQLRALGLSRGARVVLQLGQGREHLMALWGCILGGFVPAMPSSASNYREGVVAAEQLPKLCELVSAEAIVTTSDRVSSLQSWMRSRAHERLPVLAPEPGKDGRIASGAAPSSEDIALILFTSGSSGLPKAVPLRHRMVVAQAAAFNEMLEIDSSSVGFNWMPLDHAGLLLGHFTLTLAGARQYVARTDEVLRDPASWMRWLSDVRATFSWAPNVGFAQALESGGNDTKLDLSAVRVLLNAGEMVNPVIARRFLARYARAGLRDDVMIPAWGMSETSSASVVSKEFRGNASAGTLLPPMVEDEVVEVGVPLPGTAMRIVDEHGRPVQEGRQGELQVRGELVFDGYVGRDPSADFDGDWLRTGDLGVIVDGRLGLTGRAKDVLVLNGVNFSCGAVEAALAGTDGIVASSTVAAPFLDRATGSEQLAIFFVPTEQVGDRAAADSIRARLMAALQIRPGALVPLRPHQIPRTAIGKPIRPALSRLLIDGEFDRVIWPAGDRDRVDHHVLAVEAARVVVGAPWVVPRLLLATTGDPLVEGIRELDPRIKIRTLDAARPLVTTDADRGSGVLLLAPGTSGSDAIGALRALLRGDRHGLSAWTLITRGNALDPRSAALRGQLDGAIACARAEMPRDVTTRHLHVMGEVDPRPLLDLLSACWPSDRLELDGNGARRRVLRSVRLPRKPAPALRAGGRYVVVGGAGGIGRHVCRMLVDQFGAQLLVVGRSSARTIDGGRYAQLDVGTPGALEEAVERFERETGGEADGIFHLAGEGDVRERWFSADTYLLTTEARESFARAARAKVDGTLACVGLLSAREHARLVLFSSVMGHTGGRGYGSYAAANGAQQAVFEALPPETRARTACLAWAMWRETGMSRESPSEAVAAAEAAGFEVLDPDAAMRLLERALPVSWGRHLMFGCDPDAAAMQADVSDPRLSRLHVFLQDANDGALRVVRERLKRCELALPPEIRVVDDLAAARNGSGRDDGETNVQTPPQSPTEHVLVRLFAEVLDLPTEPGALADFLELGGHSLSATRLAGRVADECEVELSTTEVFETPVLRELALRIDASRSGDHRGPKPDGQIPDRWPATTLQKRLWLVEQVNPGLPVHNVPISFTVDGQVDVEALCAAFDRMVLRHPVLRSNLLLDPGGELHQSAMREESTRTVARLRSEPGEQEALELLAADAVEPFDLTHGPLARLLVVTGRDERSWLQFTFHHLAVDGRAIELLLEGLRRELSEGGQRPASDGETADFPAYASWEASPTGIAEAVRYETYWREKLAGARAPLWPTRDAQATARNLQGAAVSLVTKDDLATAIRALAADCSTTPFCVTAAAFALVVHELTGAADFLMGTPSLGRRHATVRHTIGVFTDALPLRCTTGRADETFRECVLRMRDAITDAHAHDPFPMARLASVVSDAGPDGLHSGFDVWFAQDPDFAAVLQLPGAAVTELFPRIETAKFGLQANVRMPDHGPVGLLLSHALRHVGNDSARRCAVSYLDLLGGAVEDPDASCRHLLSRRSPQSIVSHT